MLVEVLSLASDWEMLTVLVEDVERDRGWVEIVGMTGVVPSLVSRHSPDMKGRAGGGGRVLDLDDAGTGNQLLVVFPHHELGAHDGGADDALQLEGAELPHVDVRTSEYPDLRQGGDILWSGQLVEETYLGHHHHQLHLPAHLGDRAHLALVFTGVTGRHVLHLKIFLCHLQLRCPHHHLQSPQVVLALDEGGEPLVRDECLLVDSNDVAVRPSDPGD